MLRNLEKIKNGDNIIIYSIKYVDILKIGAFYITPMLEIVANSACNIEKYQVFTFKTLYCKFEIVQVDSYPLLLLKYT